MRVAPAFAATVIVTLALGIGGASTAVFRVLHGMAFPEVPYRASERLVVLGATMNRQVCVATEWLTPEHLQLPRQEAFDERSCDS